jgi:hypothetical protein
MCHASIDTSPVQFGSAIVHLWPFKVVSETILLKFDPLTHCISASVSSISMQLVSKCSQFKCLSNDVRKSWGCHDFYGRKSGLNVEKNIELIFEQLK